MPKILPTCKDGFELNRENGDCRCTRKLIKKKKKGKKLTVSANAARKTKKKQDGKSRVKEVKPRKQVKPRKKANQDSEKKSRSISRKKSWRVSRDHNSKFNEYVRRMKRIKKPRIEAAKNKLSRDNKTSKTSKTMSRSIKTSKQLLQAQKDYKELGIKEGDWIMDPCYILRNIKKKLKITQWSDQLLMNLSTTIPKLERVFLPNNTNVTYRYGSNIIKIHETIGRGAYGEVNRATMMDEATKNKKNIVVKQLQPDASRLEVFTEAILQMELFCGMRGEYGTGARIPKIEFISKFRNRYIIGMEQLDGEFEKMFEDKKITCRNKIKAIKSLAQFLIPLQKKYQFMHRDFHAANIMYKKMGTPGKETYRMYIIDFGLSTAVINKQQLNKTNDIYSKTYKFNPSQDLRLLFTYFTQIIRKPPCSYLYIAILLSLTSILRYRTINTDPWHWGVYDDAIEKLDETFTPENIITLCDYLLSLNADILEKYNSDLNDIAFDDLLPRICNKNVYHLSTTSPKMLLNKNELKITSASQFYKLLEYLLDDSNMERIKDQYNNVQVKVAI